MPYVILLYLKTLKKILYIKHRKTLKYKFKSGIWYFETISQTFQYFSLNLLGIKYTLKKYKEHKKDKKYLLATESSVNDSFCFTDWSFWYKGLFLTLFKLFGFILIFSISYVQKHFK